MAVLEWDKTGQRFFEAGVSQVALYPWDATQNKFGAGVAWNGVTNITKSPDGAEAQDFWADNIKYATLRSAETLSGSIQAYQSPPEFDQCDGSAEISTGIMIEQQKRIPFCLAYRTEIGNDVSSEAGHKIHIIYNATASPSERAYDTINDSPDAADLSWDFDTTPINVTGKKPTSSLVIDSRTIPSAKLTIIEEKLFGTANTDPECPMPDDILLLIA